MNLDYFTTRLSHNADTIRTLTEGVTEDQARWKPSPQKWSILEVINHLYDEEREDFRRRLDLLLHHPEQPWPDIDPEGWVVKRQYNQRDLEASLNDFLQERRYSLSWLKGLSSPAWETTFNHPEILSPHQDLRLSARDLLASWLAHDFLHIRQLTELHWQYLSAKPYAVAYAGAW